VLFAVLAIRERVIPATQTGPDAPDEVLVTAAIAGDGLAFRYLFDRYGTSVRRYVHDLLRDASLADEATQEVFVRAHARLDKLAKRDRVLPFLFGIARNVHLEKRRALKKARKHDSLSPADRDEDGGGGPPALVANGPSPEDSLLGNEADQVLGKALAGLREDRRAALLLRIDHGLGYPEIAETMGWSLAKVKNEIHRARLQLREALAGYMGGEA